mgnify:CR=1 FL=1
MAKRYRMLTNAHVKEQKYSKEEYFNMLKATQHLLREERDPQTRESLELLAEETARRLQEFKGA